MKIGLNMGEDTSRAPRGAIPETQILAAKNGDWAAKDRLAQTFLPLIKSLAEQRASEPSKIDKFVEAGKQGLFVAAKKYKPSIGPERFQVFALEYIQGHMDRLTGGGGFLSRLFGK